MPLGGILGAGFPADPDRMFAVDRFHPSGAGYRRIARALPPAVLAGREGPPTAGVAR